MEEPQAGGAEQRVAREAEPNGALARIGKRRRDETADLTAQCGRLVGHEAAEANAEQHDRPFVSGAFSGDEIAHALDP